MHRLAPFTVRYGDELRFAGRDLPRPRTVRVPTRHGRVPVHVYTPGRGPAYGSAAAGHAGGAGGSDGRHGAYVHFHGGAFLMRHARMDDFWCRYLASEAGVVVVNVDFHAAPQVTYPVAQEECHDAAAWVAGAGAAELGVDPARVAVGGLSSGGQLAASVALQARDRRRRGDGSFAPVLQVLGVPALDMATEPADHPGMVRPELRRLVRRVYFPDAARRAEPYASPLLADDLADLPPAVVLTAERDALRADGDAWAERLRGAGTEVLHDLTPRADHYFLTDDLGRARRTLDLVAAEVARRTA